MTGEDTVVALAYGATYGLILWFALRLNLRYRRLAKEDMAKEDSTRQDLAARDLAQRD